MKKKLTRKKISTHKKNTFNITVFGLFIILLFVIGVIFYSVNNGVINTKAKAIPDNIPPSIVGGHDAQKGAWPFMAILYFKNRDINSGLLGNMFCAGTLISPKWVLTAGHCVSLLSSKEAIGIALGYYDLNEPIDNINRIVRYVNKIVLPPNYAILPSGHSINDIALIELSKEVVNIPVISLINFSYIDNLNAKVVGWGLTDKGVRPNILQEITVPIIPNKTSNQSDWYPNNQVLDSMLTAGYEAGGSGQCWGDSGGPLLIWKETKWVQAGIVSWGKKSSDGKCEIPKNPGVYTRVSSFANWIYNTTGVKTNSGTFYGLNPSISHP